ncbi:hypothetical protein EON65_49540 [archaeon]|nr:MAG: hypothetical protein EON65_49540 [archaeon]
MDRSETDELAPTRTSVHATQQSQRSPKMLYRTARMNQFDPIEDRGFIPLPMYLSSFRWDEAAFDPPISKSSVPNQTSTLQQKWQKGKHSGLSFF